MSFKISYVSLGSGVTYGASALAYIAQSPIAVGINNAAQTLGISATAIAGAMVEEADAYYAHTWQDDALDKFAASSMTTLSGPGLLFWPALTAGPAATQLWLDANAGALQIGRTQASWEADYAAVNGDVDSSLLDKLNHPVLADVGPANFRNQRGQRHLVF